MTKKQEKLLENFIRQEVRKSLSEADDPQLTLLKAFIGGTLKNINYSDTMKVWTIYTNKGKLYLKDGKMQADL